MIDEGAQYGGGGIMLPGGSFPETMPVIIHSEYRFFTTTPTTLNGVIGGYLTTSTTPTTISTISTLTAEWTYGTTTDPSTTIGIKLNRVGYFGDITDITGEVGYCMKLGIPASSTVTSNYTVVTGVYGYHTLAAQLMNPLDLLEVVFCAKYGTFDFTPMATFITEWLYAKTIPVSSIACHYLIYKIHNPESLTCTIGVVDSQGFITFRYGSSFH